MSNLIHKSLKDIIEEFRRRLLDLTLRNRMLNYDITKSNKLVFHNPSVVDIYKKIISEKQTIKVKNKIEDEASYLFDDGIVEDICNEFDFSFEQEKINSMLLSLYKKGNIIIQEQGYNALYVACYFLEYYQDKNSDVKLYAPLFYIPINIKRKSIKSIFTIKWTGDNIEQNESLIQYLISDFNVYITPFKLTDESYRTIDAQIGKVEKQLKSEISERWSIIDAGAIDTFTFSKIAMWRDLNPDNWPDEALLKNRNLNILLTDAESTERSAYTKDQYIDDIADIKHIKLVQDADSSQLLALLDINSGKNVVVFGPPGTGKSQTITNAIATLISNGKKVLFVSEKLAALEVVKRRLEKVGLGDLCLELHSNKTNKTDFAKRILDSFPLINQSVLNIFDVFDDSTDEDDLTLHQTKLNEYANEIWKPLIKGGFSVHEVIGFIKDDDVINNFIDDHDLTIQKPIDKVMFNKHTALLGNLISQSLKIQNYQEHPWCGIIVKDSTPNSLLAIKSLLKKNNNIYDTIDYFNVDLTNLNMPIISNLAEYEIYKELYLCYKTAQDGGIDVAQIDLNSKNCTKYIKDIIPIIAEINDIKGKLKNEFIEHSFYVDMSLSIKQYLDKQRNLLRFLDSEYIKAKKEITSISIKHLKRIDRITSIKQLDRLQSLVSNLNSMASIGESLIGLYWKEDKTDSKILVLIEEMLSKYSAIIEKSDVFTNITMPAKSSFATCYKYIKSIFDILPSLGQIYLDNEFIQLDPEVCFSQNIKLVEFSEIQQINTDLETNCDLFYEWADYQLILEECNAVGLSRFTLIAMTEFKSCKYFIDAYTTLVARNYLKIATSESSLVKQFSSKSHTDLINHFRQLDRKLIHDCGDKVRKDYYNNVQGRLSLSNTKALKTIVSKKKNLPSIRQILLNFSDIITDLRPCFMMSPLSLAQYLDPYRLHFDVLIMDEASQMKIEDSLGSIARADTCIVVGDEKQLPPTSFFDKIINTLTDDDQDDDSPISADPTGIESILDLAQQSFTVYCDLKWHYRSKHGSLIHFSNTEFYQGKLLIYPEAKSVSRDFGVHSRYVKGGIYDRGGSRRNIIEAEVVARDVMAFARDNSNLSLGVVAFSTPQQSLIDDLIERFRLENYNPITEDYFDNNKVERFFVKNLETVQGDERDVIYISIGYGKDENGKFSHNFGPINSPDGWRRLNVLITRARQKCVIYHSIHHYDIVMEKNSQSSRGRNSLKNYLEYAETGKYSQALLSNAEPDSAFEMEVAEAIMHLGIQIDIQVGVSEYRIDIAIKHPQKPGIYILGIECDGATYHTAKSARDRDRLRQMILENLGWRIYRIWSLDWWKDRKRIIAQIWSIYQEILANDVNDFEDDFEIYDDEPNEILIDNNFENHHLRTIHDALSLDDGLICKEIIKLLQNRPYGTCKFDDIGRQLLRKWGVRTYGKPLEKFVHKVDGLLNTMEGEGGIKIYKAKNIRVRLSNS